MHTTSTVDNKPVRYAVVACIIITSIYFLYAHCYRGPGKDGGNKSGGNVNPEPQPQQPDPLPKDPTKPAESPEVPGKSANPPEEPPKPAEPPKDLPISTSPPVPQDPPKPGTYFEHGPKEITSDISPGSKVACVRCDGYHLFWQDQRGHIRLSQSRGMDWKNLDFVVAEDAKKNSPMAAVCRSVGGKASIGVYYLSGNNELCEAWREGGSETYKLSKLGNSGTLFTVHPDSQLAAVVENSPAMTSVPSIYLFAQNKRNKVTQYEKSGKDGGWKSLYTMPESSPGTNIAVSIAEGTLFIVYQKINEKLEVLTRKPLASSYQPWDSVTELTFEVPNKTPILCLSWKYPKSPQTYNLLFGVKSGLLHQSTYGNAGFGDSEAFTTDILGVGGGDIGFCGVVQIKSDESRVRRLYLRPEGKAVLQEFKFPT